MMVMIIIKGVGGGNGSLVFKGEVMIRRLMASGPCLDDHQCPPLARQQANVNDNMNSLLRNVPLLLFPPCLWLESFWPSFIFG